jgi:hypothetical protein
MTKLGLESKPNFLYGRAHSCCAVNGVSATVVNGIYLGFVADKHRSRGHRLGF